MVLRIVPVMGGGAHILTVTHNGSLSGAPRQSTAAFTRPPWVSHIRNPVASLGDYAQVEALNHNNRGVPVGRKSPSKGGEGTTHPHTTARASSPCSPPSTSLPAAAGCPLTALFVSAAGHRESLGITLTILI